MARKKRDPLLLDFRKDLNEFKFNAGRTRMIPDKKYYEDFSETFKKHQISIGEEYPKQYESGLVKLFMIISKHRPLLFEKKFESLVWYGIKMEAEQKMKQKTSTKT